jgi:hypothetical protein
MPESPTCEVTRILCAIERGDPHAAKQLLPVLQKAFSNGHLAPRLRRFAFFAAGFPVVAFGFRNADMGCCGAGMFNWLITLNKS